MCWLILVYKKVNFCPPPLLTSVILFLKHTDLCMYIFVYFYFCCSEVVSMKFDTSCRQINHLPVGRQMFFKCLWQDFVILFFKFQMQCFILFFFFNYHFLRLEKYEDESKLLTLELRNKSAELGKIYRRKKTKLGNKKRFLLFFENRLSLLLGKMVLEDRVPVRNAWICFAHLTPCSLSVWQSLWLSTVKQQLCADLQ